MYKRQHEQYVTLLPKSITTAIGMGVSEELGGIVTITAVSYTHLDVYKRQPYALPETQEKMDILAAEMEEYMDERIRNKK